ncbi:unnamed protein product [Acanthoscelides obtectus]|uniref:Uncharacterized protein n=1 Tax=Acanthoscelides obtectus TaxID=200917 RepID=A0A9P0KJG7_ACAOB|nr:unnamed protein product [Acanthoscelides obtectus]CAK1662911.1 hypothetical protein AOBTE_LOCUS23377 [Acanthoscelides obtectus]
MIKIANILISLAILGATFAQQAVTPAPFVHPYGSTPFLSQHFSTDYYKNLPPHSIHPDYYKNLPQHYQTANYYKNFPHYQNTGYLNQYHNLPAHLRPTNYYKNLPDHYNTADYQKNLPEYYKNHEYYRTAEFTAPIVKYDSDVREDGSYDYSYQTGNGISAQESGVQRPSPPVGELGTSATGSYSYTSPEGVPVSIAYVADENGFRAAGDVLPTPPPIPLAIQRSLEFNAAHEKALPVYPTVPVPPVF